MTDPKYAAFTALDPFFDIVQQGLAGLVDGDHYFDTIADEAEFESRYHFPDGPRHVDDDNARVLRSVNNELVSAVQDDVVAGSWS